MIQGMKNLPYEDTLKHVNLHYLERRRFWGDLIELYKWMMGFNKGDINKVLVAEDPDKTSSNVF